MVLRIGVIGAGVVGLSSAIVVQNQLPEAQVDVIADKFTIHTTSHGSGGLFVPKADGSPKDLNERWAKDGAKHFFGLAKSSEAGASGVNFISGFYLYNSDQGHSWLKEMIGLQDIPAEFNYFSKFYKNGNMHTTVIVEGAKYLPWLTKRFIANGGRVFQKTVGSFDELCDDYDLVLNCAGLGAGALASDPKVHPVKGQLVRISAPWIKYFVHCEDTHYILPQSDSTAVGGIRHIGIGDREPESHETDRIMKEMKEILPALEGAKILYEWVGIRPTRNPLRLEPEIVTCKGKQLKVIHNYGHGANGVSLSWGTAVHAAELAQQALRIKAKI